MKILALNCGSSSLKFQVVEVSAAGGSTRRRKLAGGLIERIGGEASCSFALPNRPTFQETAAIRDHREAVEKVLSWLRSKAGAGFGEIDAAGHRVVHGGERFTAPARIDDDVIAAIEAVSDLAPLHNEVSVSGIRACREALGASVPMVAVFDTAFHRTIPDFAAVYAIPYDLSERHRIRRYGFHGLAHEHSVTRYAEMTATPREGVNVVTLHLGNGCSAAAIRGGKSVDTSMGFTPLEGLVMGTRSGDIDPALVTFLARKEGVALDDVEALLNERSGLLGVSGKSRDARAVVEAAPSDRRARLALEIFCYRARKYLGAYLAVVEGADAVIFSGGIGENQPLVRAGICRGMEWCGLELEPERNEQAVGAEARISPPAARVQAYVIPTDEESVIARATAELLIGQA